MRMIRIIPLIFGLATLHVAMAAAEPSTSDLPPLTQVRATVLARPEVKAMDAHLRAQAAEAERLQLGPHEWSVRVTAQQRRAQEQGAAGRYTEGQVALERAVRLGGKAELDAEIGQRLQATATLQRNDAIHEVSRTLLRAWFDWLRDRELVRLWQAQLKLGEALLQVAQRRVRAGDAAQMELRQQEASQAQAEAELRAAQAREATSGGWLALHHPGLNAAAPVLAEPQARDLPEQDDTALASALEAASHEAQLARLEAELAATRAQRQALERHADPTLGVFVSSERGGAERLAGGSIQWPLGSAARAASERQALAQADVAREQAQLVQRKVQAEAQAQCTQARAALHIWRAQADASQRQAQLVQTSVRAWELGEYSQSDVQLARRQFIELARREIEARSEARHAAMRIWLDLHAIWEFDDD